MERRREPSDSIGDPGEVIGAESTAFARLKSAAMAALSAMALLFASIPGVSPAAEDRVREAAGERIAADILVMIDDVRRLREEGLGALHRRGIFARIDGALAGFSLSARQAREGNPRLPAIDRGQIEALRRAVAEKDLLALDAGLGRLAKVFPFSALSRVPTAARPADIAAARRIHEAYCAGCHDMPDVSVARPAWNLFDLARAAPPRAFAARMIAGVRGDRSIAMENPLTPEEIAGLAAFYRDASAAGR